MPSKLYCTSAPYEIIGILHKYKTEWIVFSTDNTNSEIGTFDEADCSYTKIVNAPCLNFNTKYTITGAIKYNADCTYSAYWADNNNPDRTMNLDNPPFVYTETATGTSTPNGLQINCVYKTPTDELNCESLRLHPLVQQPCITVNTSIGAGQLQNGSYQAVIAYSYNGIKLTDYSTPSQPQAIWDHTGIGGSIDINITNLDFNFDEYELVVISVINQQTVAKKIGNYSTMQSSVHLDLYLESLETIPLNVIPLKSQVYEKSKKMFSLNGYLIRTSVTTQPYFNYQPFANLIKTEWVSVQYPADYYWKKGNKVGYMRDEVYSFFIRWVYKTGARSASFHIPGRPSISDDTLLLPADNVDITDSTRNEIWQVYDTSTSSSYTNHLSDGGLVTNKGLMGYWESYSETYPHDKPEIWNSSSYPWSNINNPDFDLCGKPIRHHKMPSNETTHIHDNTGEYINILGVQFSNIKHPVNNAGEPIESIVGYEILRGSREGNRSIIAKGMFNNMLHFDIQNSSLKGLMQNYPYNDLHTDPFYTSNNAPRVIPKYDYFSFHSPETTIVKPYLGSGIHAKLYTEEIGIMKGTFTVPYKHPREKLINDVAFTSAIIVALGIALVSILGNTSISTSSTGHLINLSHVGAITSTVNREIPPGDTGGVGIDTYDLITGDEETGAPTVNADSSVSTTTSGGLGTAGSGIGNMVTAAAAAAGSTAAGPLGSVTAAAYIAGLIGSISSFVFYVYEGVNTMLDIIYKIIPFTDYVLQFNSHAFYNSYSNVFSKSKPLTVSNPSISRSIKSSKYTSSGVQDFDANYRINNLYRNKFVTLNIPRNIDAPITSDNTKKTADNYGINTEVTGTTVGYYGALKFDYKNQYGQIASIVQLPTDSCVYNTKPVSNITYATTQPIFGGDVYINRYTEKNMYAFFNTWAYDLPDDTPFDYTLYYNGPKPEYWANFRHFKANDFKVRFTGDIPNIFDIATPNSVLSNLNSIGSDGLFSKDNAYMYLFNNGVRDFFTESELNMAFRDYGENEWEKFYDVYGNSFNDLNTMFRSDIITKPIYYKYDLSLSTSRLYNNFASWGSVLPPDFNPVVYETCYQYFPYRGIYSLQQQDGLKRDNWRNFLPLNYYTFEGIVTNIKSVNSSGALIIYEDFSPSQFVGVDTLKTEAGTKVTLGDGGLFANNIQSLANAEDVLDYGASISNRATLNTPYGLFYVSQKAGKIIQYGSEGLQEISKSGMKNWFLQNLPSELLKAFPNFTEYDNPIDGIAVQAVYDAQYELLYFTKKDYKPISNCIGYTPEYGFYDKCSRPSACPSGYTFNPGTKMCDKIVDKPVCQEGFTYNFETNKCEAIIRTPALC